MKLAFSALAKYLVGLALVGLLLFLPAGTWNYPEAWLFIGLLFIPMLFLGTVLYFKAPELLKKRLKTDEKEKTQRDVIGLSGIIFLVGFILAGLDHRYGWSHISVWLTAASSVLFLVAYGLYAEVMRENAYLSRTVEVQEDQKVIDTGLYGVVRHPMYLASILLFLSMPIVLGSWYPLAVFGLYPFMLAARIKNEEKVLEAGLKGYTEYKRKVRYRLVPFIW